jgi:RNA polymerase sigma-70 factor, ECF subfamily
MTNSALGDALTRLLPRLWNFSLHLMGDAKLAEELVRCTCLTASDCKDELPRDVDAMTWLLSVLHSVWHSNFCGKGMRYATADIKLSQALGKDDHEHQHRRIVSAVTQLPDAQRFAMLLVTVEYVNVKNASEILGITIGAVMDLVLQARLTIGFHFYDPPGRLEERYLNRPAFT